MTPNLVQIGDVDYRLFERNSVNYPAAPIPTYNLWRVFNLVEDQGRTINFANLTGTWELESLWISSPADSAIEIEIQWGSVTFFSYEFERNNTPIQLPTVTVDSNITMNLTARRADIDALLLYLSPCYLETLQDF